MSSSTFIDLLDAAPAGPLLGPGSGITHLQLIDYSRGARLEGPASGVLVIPKSMLGFIPKISDLVGGAERMSSTGGSQLQLATLHEAKGKEATTTEMFECALRDADGMCVLRHRLQSCDAYWAS